MADKLSNTLSDHIANLETNVGDVTTLSTTAKKVVPAINEQNVAISNRVSYTAPGNINTNNINNYTNTGIYQSYFDGTGLPFVSSWGILIVIHANSAVIEQIQICNAGIACRHCENGTWGSWKKTTFA